MHIRGEFNLKSNEEQYFVVSDRDDTLSISLDSIGVFLFENLKKKNLGKSELLNLLLNSFDISTVLALGTLDTFLRKMRENSIIEE